jgi:hypothetical protein
MKKANSVGDVLFLPPSILIGGFAVIPAPVIISKRFLNILLALRMFMKAGDHIVFQ